MGAWPITATSWAWSTPATTSAPPHEPAIGGLHRKRLCASLYTYCIYNGPTTLLALPRPGLALGEVHLEAMKLLVAALEKRRFALTDEPRKPARPAQTGADAVQSDEIAARAVAAEQRFAVEKDVYLDLPVLRQYQE